MVKPIYRAYKQILAIYRNFAPLFNFNLYVMPVLYALLSATWQQKRSIAKFNSMIVAIMGKNLQPSKTITSIRELY